MSYTPFHIAMSVANVRVAHIRPKYHNLAAWMQDANNVYVGRRGVVMINSKRFPERDSLWANPFRVGKDGTRDRVIAMYEVYIVAKIAEQGLEEELEALRGKTLGCWCAPEPCHAEILLRLIDEQNK